MLSAIKKRINKYGIIGEVELGGTIYEDKEKISVPFIKSREKTTVFDLYNVFKYFSGIPVKAVLFKIGNLNIGFSRASFIRDGIEQLRDEGIETVVYLESGGNVEYFIASAADCIYVSPWTTLNLVGLHSETFFLKDFFSRMHVEPEIEGKGNYKSAAELFSRNDMSDYNREMINSILDQNFSLFREKISASRNIDSQTAEKMIDNGPYLSDEALDSSLVDGIGYLHELKDSLRQKFGKNAVFIDDKKAVKAVNQRNGLKSLYYRLSRKKLAIGVITVEGLITEGESKSGSSQLKTCGASTVINNLQKAEKNPAIGAIIIRVLSPGGSALASDLIRSEIEKIRDKKPVLVSMSDVAASGGYMLSLSANRIFADGFTLTGSIGVVSGKFNFSGLLERLDINHESVSRGKNASIYSSLKKFTPEEKTRISSMIDTMYQNFTGLVSKSRNLDKESVENAAQGRVWTGNQAKDLKIIDETGSLHDSVEYAKNLLGIEESTEPVFRFYRTKIDLGDLGKSLSLNFRVFDIAGDLFRNEKVLALMPFYTKIR